MSRILFRIVAAAAFVVLAAAVPTSALADSNPAGGSGGSASQGGWKAAHDSDPHAPIINVGPHHQGVAPSHQGVAAPLTVPSDFVIGTNQQGQQTSYWCGPAAVSEAIGLLGYVYSQGTEASLLKTTTGGTAWSGVNANVPAQFQTGYPVRDVIDYEWWANNGYSPGYVVVGLPYTPSQTDINNYKSNITYDLSNWWPVVSDAWEVAGYPHLTGHPHNQTIYHWFTTIGYGNYGNQTDYEDSATTVWSTVPAYTYGFDTPTMVGILGGRGYVW